MMTIGKPLLYKGFVAPTIDDQGCQIRPLLYLSRIPYTGGEGEGRPPHG